MARPATRARHGGFIYQRPEKSPFWYVKLRHGGKRVEISLRTTDKAQAQIAATPLIQAHREALLAARPTFTTVWAHRLAPGRKHVVDGQEVIATDKELIFVGPDGTVRTEPNGEHVQQVSSVPRLGIFAPVDLGPVNPEFVERPKLAIKNSDDALFETYLEHAKGGAITGHALREALDTWATFKALMAGKPLKDATRDDGRKLAQHLAAQGVKSATVKKKVGRLCAAVNLAIRDGRRIDDKSDKRWTFNPFSGVAPQGKDKLKRKPLDPGDIEAIKGGFDKLDKNDQLLIRLLATTGMRPKEAMSIESEEPPEHGIRFCIVGTKNEQSLRRVPFPDGVLDYLPPKITKPLFDGDADAASKRLMKFLRSVGIVEKAKVIYSLRHRAQDRLRAAECIPEIREALFGRDEITVGDGYGDGYPVTLLKKWIDRIGF